MSLSQLDHFIELRKQLKKDAKRMIRDLAAELERVLFFVNRVHSIYCMLKTLDAADGINLDEFLDKELQNKIENLLEIFGLECRIDF